MKITLIAALGANRELGKDNRLIWHLPNDLKRFKQVTMGHCMIMGRKTFDGFGKPLPGRTHIVITRNKNLHVEGVIFVETLKQAFIAARNLKEQHCFVIGGAQIFEQSLPYADTLDLTHVDQNFDADVFFPPIDPKKFRKVKQEDFDVDEKHKFPYSFTTYESTNKKDKALFLDRDGVLNKEIREYITRLEDFEMNVSMVPLLQQKQKEGYKLIVITNQGAIDKGLLSKEKLHVINALLVEKYAEHGVHFDAIYYCPHHSDISNCLCRKPKSLMLEKAIARFNININESFMIGDHERDRGCAEGAGVQGFVIPPNQAPDLIF